jgi:hypothetical protein
LSKLLSTLAAFLLQPERSFARVSLDGLLPTNWEDYVATISEKDDLRHGSRTLKRFRLSLQFAAELTQMERNPEGLSVIYQLYREEVRRSLQRLQELGIVRLPFGLEQTTELHMQLFLGAGYQIASNRDLSVDQALETLNLGLAITAGLVGAKLQAQA